MAERKILFVDDEVNILKTMKRLFMDEEYTILTASGGEEALQLIEDGEKPQVIVSDHRMPEMTGAEFLARTKSILPHCVKIMLTGYSDINSAVEAINKGGIYRYILKPWDDEELKRTIAEAFGHYDLVQENIKLTRQLQESNTALEELNRNLEMKVQERTQELKDAFEKNLKLTAVLQYKVKELEGRDRILQHMLTFHPLEETLQLILNVLAGIFPFDFAAFYLYEEESEHFTTASLLYRDKGEPTQVSPEEVELPEREIIRIKKVLASEKDEVFAGRGFTVANKNITTHTTLSVPLIKTSDKLGVIEICRINDTTSFREEEIATVRSLSIQAAVAINESRLQQNLPGLETALDEVLLYLNK